MAQLVNSQTKDLNTTTQQDYILLDGSSSMKPQWWDSLDAIQAYVDGVKNQNILSDVTVHVFSSRDLEYIARKGSINQWVPLRQDPIGSLWGGTPLYFAINRMGLRLRDLDPPKASIVIVTDGDDTTYDDAARQQAIAVLNWMRAKGWQVTFIGANFDNEKQGELLGGNKESVIGVSTARLVDAASALAKKRGKYSLYGTPMHWSEDEQNKFGGFLGGPNK